MLSDEQKEHIRLEEIFRKEISESLRISDSFLKKVLIFFNSGLGIFLLSTVFVTGFSTIYAEYQENIRNEVYSRKVEVELAYRLSFFPLLTQEKFTFTQLHSVRGALSGSTEEHPQFGLLGEYQSIFPEFKNRTLLSILWENKSSFDFTKFGGYKNLLMLAKSGYQYTEFVDLDRLKGPDEEGDSEWKLTDKQKSEYFSLVSKVKTDTW